MRGAQLPEHGKVGVASCDRSQEAINEFNAVYPDLRKEVEAILSKYPDNAQFYDYILKIKSGEAGLSAEERSDFAHFVCVRVYLLLRQGVVPGLW